ncbi:MAG: hypothetical protein Q9179_001493 [Wetmoreana sp. 5 TL-2023]
MSASTHQRRLWRQAIELANDGIAHGQNEAAGMHGGVMGSARRSQTSCEQPFSLIDEPHHKSVGFPLLLSSPSAAHPLLAQFVFVGTDSVTLAFEDQVEH